MSFKKRQFCLWTAVVAVGVLIVPVLDAVRADEAADKTTSNVYDSDTMDVTGSSQLTRTNNGVSMTLSTTGLEPGAYTCWFVVFNHPEFCGDEDGCGIHPDDFLPASEGGLTGFGFTYATGQIVGESGKATFAANLKQGEILLNDFLEEDEVLEDARTADIHLIVRYHGPADPERIYEQTHTLEPDLGIGPDVDVQFSVHEEP